MNTSNDPAQFRHHLSELVRAVMKAPTMEAIAEAVCQACEKLFAFDCFIFTERLPQSEEFLRVLVVDTIDGAKVRSVRDSSAKPHKSLAELHEGKPLIINRAPDSNEILRPVGSGKPSRSLLYAPMMLDGMLYGVASVQSYTPNRYREDDLELLKFIAELAAPAFKRVVVEQELKTSRERFRCAIEQMNAVPYERLATGSYSFIGDGVVELTGYSGDELIGGRNVILETIPEGPFKGLDFQEALRVFRTGEIRNWSAILRIKARDGRIKWVRDTGVGLHDDKGKWIKTIGTLQDITEERKSQQLRENLAKLGASLSAVRTPKEAARQVSLAAEQIPGWDACFVSFYSADEDCSYTLLMIDTIDGKRVEFPAEYGRPNRPGKMYQKTLAEGAQIINQEDIPANLTEYMGDTTRMSASLMYAPIRDREHGIGLISIQSYTPHAYTAHDLSILQLYADYCAAAIVRTRVEEKVKEKDDRYRAAIAHANAVPYERDYLGDTLEYMGNGIQELTGYSRQELTLEIWVKLIKEIIPLGEAKGMTVEDAREKAHAGEIKNWKADYRIETKDGRTKWVSDSSISIFDEHGRVTGTLGILQDITERVQSERRAKLLSKLGYDLSAAQTTKEVAHVLANATDEIVGFDCFYVMIYSAEDDLATNIINYDLDTDGVKREFPSIYSKPTPPSPVIRRTLKEGAFVLNREESENSEFPLLTYGNVARRSESMLFVPIRKRGDRNVGMMSVQSYVKNRYSAEHLDIIQAIADHGSGALERTFAEERLKEAEKRSSAFAALAHGLNNMRSAHEAGELIAMTAKELIGWNSFALNLYDSEKKILIHVLSLDTVEDEVREYPPRHPKVGLSQNAKRAIEQGAFLITRTPAEVEAESKKATGTPFGNWTRKSASLMYAPARMGNTVIAMITIQSYTFNAYGQSDLEVLQVLADHCSGALERIASETSLRESEERFALAARGANDGLWDWDLTTNIVYYSPRLKDILGLHDEMTDRPDDWFSRVHPEDLLLMQQEMDNHLKGQTAHYQSEHRLLRRDNTYCWVLCRGLAVRDQSGRAVRFAGSITEITERRLAEEQLAKAAFYDSLTGLANRSLFMDRLEHCLTRARRKPSESFAVLFIDIDRFKMINDSMGHIVGDKLLQEIAKRFQRNLRESDTLARLGGDEFTVLLEDHRDSNQALRIAERLLGEFREPFFIEQHEIFANASIGIAVSTTGYARVEEILRDADTALYRAKELGRGRSVMFDQQMHEKISEYIGTENGIRIGLRNNEFCLHYQPIIRIDTGEISGFEALIRWNRPGEGLVAPMKFIPIAEETGLIVPLGEWVLKAACTQMAEWCSRYPGAERMFMSVNLSPRQFCSVELGPLLLEILKETNLDPSLLHVEITETAILKEPENVRSILERWREQGIRILLDDFGTGFSPLAHLVTIPVDCIKIDRRFVGLMNKNVDSQHMVRAVLSLARVFNLSVIAEGAETAQQLEALRDLDCEFAQGYFISKPVPPEVIEDRYLANSPVKS